MKTKWIDGGIIRRCLLIRYPIGIVGDDFHMDCRERVKLALNHKEPDRIPLDFGAGIACGISIRAYEKLLNYLGIKVERFLFSDFSEQCAQVDEIVYEKFGVDFRPIHLHKADQRIPQVYDETDHYWFDDEWGRKWKMPKEGGHYFDIVSFPLANSDIGAYSWPDPKDPVRFIDVDAICDQYHRTVDAVLVFPDRLGNGFLQMGAQLYGYDNWFMMLISDEMEAERFLGKYLEIKVGFWDSILSKIGNRIDIVCELDDLGAQTGPLVSLEMYRKFIKPKQKELFSFIKSKADVKIFFHSCGSVQKFLPDFIEVGIDIINPVQFTAAHMALRNLKRDFGKDLVFWGGGIDTQRILPYGSKQEITDEVKRNIDELAQGGGFVFSTVHNIQDDVPPQNIITMLEAFHKYCTY